MNSNYQKYRVTQAAHQMPLRFCTQIRDMDDACRASPLVSGKRQAEVCVWSPIAPRHLVCYQLAKGLCYDAVNHICS